MSLFLSALLFTASASAAPSTTDFSHIGLRVSNSHSVGGKRDASSVSTMLEFALHDGYLKDRIHAGMIVGFGVTNSQITSDDELYIASDGTLGVAPTVWYDLGPCWVGGGVDFKSSFPRAFYYLSGTGLIGVQWRGGNSVVELTGGYGMSYNSHEFGVYDADWKHISGSVMFGTQF